MVESSRHQKELTTDQIYLLRLKVTSSSSEVEAYTDSIANNSNASKCWKTWTCKRNSKHRLMCETLRGRCIKIAHLKWCSATKNVGNIIFKENNLNKHQSAVRWQSMLVQFPKQKENLVTLPVDSCIFKTRSNIGQRTQSLRIIYIADYTDKIKVISIKDYRFANLH